MITKEMIKKIGMTKEEVLKEAELVEKHGDWTYPALIGYSADELREAAENMADKGEEEPNE